MVPATIRTPRYSMSNWVITTLLAVLFLTLSLLRDVHADKCINDEEFCPIGAGVDLTNATRNTSGYIAQSGYFFPLERVKLVDDVLCGCMCDFKSCLPFCPPPKVNITEFTHFDDNYVESGAIPDIYTENLTTDDEVNTLGPKQWFHFVILNPCPNQQVFLDPKNHTDDEYYFLRDGSIFRPRMNETIVRFLNPKNYCLRLQDNHTYIPKVCRMKIIDSTGYYIKVQYIGGLLSALFSVLTLIIYSVLPELRNIHGSILCSYLYCIIATYIMLAVQRIHGRDSSTISYCFEIINYFSFIAKFMWLNVMCFDVWWKFSDFASLQIQHQNNSAVARHNRMKFIGYSIYAWGVSVILSVILYVSKPYHVENLEIICYYVPIGITIACNICFFISISINIFRHHTSTKRHLNNRDSTGNVNNKHKFRLYLKLFVLMGISWLTNIMWSFIAAPIYVQHVTEMINVCQGIFIFVIFVCRKSIWLSLKKRFNKENLRVLLIYQLSNRIRISRNTFSYSLKSGVTDKRKIPSGNPEERFQITQTVTSEPPS